MERGFNKLRGRIYEKYRTIANFAEHIDYNRSAVSRFLNGRTKMTLDNIKVFCSALDIKDDEIADFFCIK